MKLVIREVLYGAYMGQAHHGRMLSHAAEVDDQGQVVRVLCGNVKPGSLADGGATDSMAQDPTCPRCGPKWRKARWEKTKKDLQGVA